MPRPKSESDHPEIHSEHDLSRRNALTLVAASALGVTGAAVHGQSSPTSTGSRTDVRDFGAIGDGKKDDTDAIQAALDASKCVELPPGVYSINRALEIDSGHILLGCGSTLLGAGNHAGIRRRSGTDFIEFPVIRDLRLENLSIGLETEGMSWGDFQRLIVARCRVGYRLATGDNGTCYYNTVTSCHITGEEVDVGVLFEGMKNARFQGRVSGANTNLFQGCKFGGEKICVDIHAPVSNLVFSGCAFERGAPGVVVLGLGTVNDDDGNLESKVLKAAFFGCRFEGGARIGGDFEKGKLLVGEHAQDCSFFGSAIAGGVSVDDQGFLTNWFPLQGAGGHHQIGFALDMPGPVTARNLVLGGLVVLPAEPQDVLVIAPNGRLKPCTRALDRKVAGVLVSRDDPPFGQTGALGTVASVGPVVCKADATFGAIKTGDLLTTSRTRGHAMKARYPRRAVGAILGKALDSLRHARGTIRVLMTLQ